jgi:hypothetical protein
MRGRYGPVVLEAFGMVSETGIGRDEHAAIWPAEMLATPSSIEAGIRRRHGNDPRPHELNARVGVSSFYICRYAQPVALSANCV